MGYTTVRTRAPTHTNHVTQVWGPQCSEMISCMILLVWMGQAGELEANILWPSELFLSLKCMEVSEEFKKERKCVQFQTNILNRVI